LRRRLRWLRAVLAAAIAATGLTSCGSGGGGAVLHVLVGIDTLHAAAQQPWFQHIQRAFKAKTGASVEFDTFTSAGDEQTKIQLAVISGTGPDVYQLGTTFIPVAYATGGFHTLTPSDWQRIGNRGKFTPTALGMSGPDARHDIAVPTALRPYGMVYNTDLFRAAGISSPPTTWDDFVADAERLTSSSTGVYGTAADYADGFDPWKYIWTYTLQSGGRLISADNRKALLDSPQVADAVERYFGLLTTDHIVDPASVGWNSAQATAAFADGKAAMLPMVTPQVEPTLDHSPVKGKYAYVPMPLVPFGATERPSTGVAAGSIVSGDELAIAGYSKHLDLALAYISLVTSPAEQVYYNHVFGDLPAVPAADRLLASSDPNIPGYVAAEGTSVPTTFTGAWSAVQLALGNVVTQSLPALAHGGYSPSAVRALLATANQSVQAALDRGRH
jgi:multiple sugar transport system substrate-binding protein